MIRRAIVSAVLLLLAVMPVHALFYIQEGAPSGEWINPTNPKPWDRVVVYFTAGWLSAYADYDSAFVRYTTDGWGTSFDVPSGDKMASEGNDDGHPEGQGWRVKTHIPAPGRGATSFQFTYYAKDIWANVDWRSGNYSLAGYDSNANNVQWADTGSWHDADSTVEGQSYAYRTKQGSTSYAASVFDNETMVIRARAYKEDLTTMRLRCGADNWAETNVMSYVSGADTHNETDFNNAFTVEFWQSAVTPETIGLIVQDTSYFYYNFAYVDGTDDDYLLAADGTGGTGGSAMQDAASGGQSFFFRIYDDDTTAPSISASTGADTFRNLDFIVTVTATDTQSGISATRSRAYFSWTATPGPSNYFDSSTATSLGGNVYSFTCDSDAAGGEFANNIGRKLYWIAYMADNDSDGGYGERDSKTASTSGSAIILPLERDLVINELGRAGSAVANSGGDYIELFNRSGGTIYTDNMGCSTTRANIPPKGTSDSIAAGAYYLMEDLENVSSAVSDSVVGDLLTLESNDTVELRFGAVTIDSAQLFGTNISQEGAASTSAVNQISQERRDGSGYGLTQTNWQPAARVFAGTAQGAATLYAGTPRAVNSGADMPIYISEIMSDSTGAYDSSYVELYNDGPDTYVMYAWSMYIGANLEVTAFSNANFIVADSYYLIEENAGATTIAHDLQDAYANDPLSANKLKIHYLYSGPSNAYTLVDQAGAVDQWYTPMPFVAVEKARNGLTSDGTDSTLWGNSSGAIGGCTGTPRETNTFEPSLPPQVSGANIRMISSYDKFYAGKQFQVSSKYTDVNGAATMDRFDLRIANGVDTIALYAFRPSSGAAVTIDAGSAYVLAATVDSSYFGNDVTCTWTITLDWDFVEAADYKFGVRATDMGPETSAWSDSTLSWSYENDLVLSGTLSNNQGIADGGTTDKYSTAVIWTGLTVYYQGSTVSPDNANFDIFLNGQAGNATQASGAALSQALTTRATNGTDYCTVTVINIPAGGSFDSATTKGMTFTLTAVSDRTIVVDGSATEWLAGEKIPTMNTGQDSLATWFGVTWNDTDLYVAWDKQQALHDSDVLWFYIDVIGGGFTTTNNWGGTHTLPYACDTAFHYEVGANKLEYWKDNGGTIQWVGAIGAKAQHVLNGIVEVSVPWSIIGPSDTFRIFFYVFNQTSGNHAIYSIAPLANRTGAASKTLTSYLEYPRAASGVTPNSRVYFRSNKTWQAPTPSVLTFSPQIDGVKDPAWGSTPAASSPGYKQPNPGAGDTIAIVPTGGICRDVYVTNDAQWLYIGWEAFGDPFDPDWLDTYWAEQSAHYGFLISDTSAWGSPYDPWKSSGQTRVAGHAANVWVELFANFAQTDMPGAHRYVSDGRTWDLGTTLTLNKDYAAYLPTLGRGWGEIRVPLSSISADLHVGETIAIIHYGRHNGYKPGVDDLTPYDPAVASDWSASNAVMEMSDTRVIVYVIQQGVLAASHRPDSSPVTGVRKMRTPATIRTADQANLLIEVEPAGIMTSGVVKYSTNGGGAWSSSALSSEFTSGGSQYWSALLPTLTKDSVVTYYFTLQSDQMTSYLHGSDTYSTVVSVEATAQSMPFGFIVANTATTAPTSVTISPSVPGTTDTLIATASGAGDSDAADLLVYRFEWFRNNISNFVAYDASAPYTSSVPPDSTAANDTWQVKVSAGDGTETSSLLASALTPISSVSAWPGTLHDEVNSGRVVTTSGVTEWIWRDKAGEGRSAASDLDLREARIKADTDYIYFLIRLGAFDVNVSHVVIAIDTALDGTGGSIIGDESQVSLDSQISSPPLRHTRQIAIHAVTAGNMAIELDTGGGGAAAWGAPLSGDSLLNVSPAAGLIEARLKRSDLLLDGVCTFRVAIAVFANVAGSAATIDATSDQTGHDGFDAISIAAAGLNDSTRLLSAWNEDLSDADLDFWAQLNLGAVSLLSNTAPDSPGSPTPWEGMSYAGNPPLFTWGAASDPDVGDTVIAYLFELDNPGTDFQGTILYRTIVKSQTYILPSSLTDSVSYTWRVRPIDRAGQIGGCTTLTFFLENEEDIIATAPQDNQNVDNMNRINGNSVAGTTIRWTWAPAIQSYGAPMDSYVVEIDTAGTFTSVNYRETVPGSVRQILWSGAQRGWTYYARVMAIDTGGAIGYSPASDGIYVSRRQIDGDSSDWAGYGGYSNNSANFAAAAAEGIWKDTQDDERVDGKANATSRDLVSFHVTADPYNLYFLVSTQDFVNATCLGQIAISYDGSSDVRALQGTATPSQDIFTATRWAWERLVRWRTGNDDCYVLNPTYSAQPARYSKNASGHYVELCVPLEQLGSADKILGQSVSFTVATFINSGGSVGLQNGIYEPNTVDVITSEAGNTWNEVSDKCINYALTVTFDTGGRVTTCTGTLETSAYAPPVRNDDRAPLSEERDLIMYNVFVDRFQNGRTDNEPSDPDMTGGDFQGLMDSMSYFNIMGFNCIYTSPVADFGGGAWGYNQSDLYAVQWSFADPTSKWYRLQSFIELAKKARNHNIKISIDWVPGQIYEGRTTARHPDIVDGKRFGGERVREDWSNARQFFADHSLNWAAMGAVGLRADNTKFYQPNDDPPNGMPFYRYMRKKWDDVYPGIYVYGEQPGSASDIAGYVTDGMRMDGQLDFPLREQINSWVGGWQTADQFRGAVEGLLSTYAPKGLMAGFIENHDHTRTYHNMGGGSDNDGYKNTGIMARIRAGYMFSSLHAQPPVFFYGDEVPITGFHEKVYPLSWDWASTPDAHGTQQHGQTRAIPWNFPDGTWLRDDIADYYSARNVFGQMRSGDIWLINPAPHADILGYRRGNGAGDQEKIVGYVNRSGGAVGGITISTGDAGITYRDWIGLGTYQDGDVVAIPAEGLILVKGSFGRYSMEVDAGEPGVIVSIDNNTAWTNITGTDGKAWIHRIMTAQWVGTTNRTLYWWKPGYTVHSRSIYFPTGGGWLGDTFATVSFVTPDVTGPPAPTGLSAVSRDRATWLRWEPVYDYPTEDPQSHVTYRIYRSTTPNNSSPDWIMETLQPWYYDNNTDDFLTNGTTYYYKIRAADRNGNLSAWSPEVSSVPNTMRCKFYFTTEGVWSGTPSSVKIAGNHPALGTWTPMTMTQLDTSLWYFECEIDPTTMPEYKFVVDDQWEWNDKFYSNDVSYDRHGRPRLVTIVDHAGDGTAVFTNAWNVDGDVAPRKVQNAVAVGSETGVYIGWKPNLEADVYRYVIERSTDDITYNWVGDAVATQNFFLDMTVSAGTTYYYKVRADDWWGQNGDFSAASQASVVVSDTTAPSPPAAPAVKPVDTGTILLTWAPNSEGDLAGYTVYRSTDPTVPTTLANRLNVTLVSPTFTPSYNDTTVTAGVQYYYRLTTVDQAGNSSTGSETRAAMLVAATFEVDLAVVVPSSVEISGSAWSLGPSPARVTMMHVGGTTWRRAVGLLAGEAITYRYSYNGGLSVEGTFPTSSQKREYTPPSVAAVTLSQDWDEEPLGVSATVAYPGNKVIYIYWTSDSSVDVIGYTIERASASDSVFRSITPTALTGNVYTDSGLTNGETYFYRIRSIDGGTIQLVSPPSRTATATPEEPVWIRFRVDLPLPSRRERLLAGRLR